MALLPIAATSALTSIALAATASTPRAEMSANKKQVRYGKAVRLSGAVPGLANSSVQITFRRAGTERWRPVRRTRTNQAGTYRSRVKPGASGSYRAQPPERQASTPVPVRVRSVTKVRVKRHLIRGKRVKVSGRVRPAGAGRRVVLKLPGSNKRTRTRSGGKFKRSWAPPGTGMGKVRAVAKGDRTAAASRSRARKVTVYRPATASWFGPGFYGNRTACGQTLGTSTLGVAHKTMRCGTKLTLRHRGRSVRVKVIDRGPYVAGREFDLTGATKNRLRFGSTGTVLSSR